jgi:hypothetical protein
MLEPKDCQTTIAPTGSIRAECLGARDVAEGKAIDLLKIDTEGSEWDILQEPSLLQRTKHCVLEYHVGDKSHNVERLKELIGQGKHRIVRIKEVSSKTGYLWSDHM